jgi:AcrR family transcriptional regulator
LPRSGPSDLDVSVASQRRAQIMRAVMSCIADDGLEKTTMRNVAERSGVSTGTIAYYFKSKKEMVDAALLEASQRYMEVWYAQRGSGPWSLDHLVERFLATDNTDAGFVLQMIEVGLHNSELRNTHQEFVDAGRYKIEEALRQGVAAGRVRPDVDPKLAAAMLHGVLIWWGSELMSNATSQDLARQVGRLTLRLLEAPPSPAKARRRDDIPEGAPTVQTMRALLLSDPKLPRRAADALADAFEKLYDGVAT